ncbi:cell adhesion molecule 2-like [Brevipalpus obovatus]|uniref:cell adhesion molecule 2-like n=1 Tax=Brevipalpus obovatus TaxID=246614 RepID=UPI003D9E4F9D
MILSSLMPLEFSLTEMLKQANLILLVILISLELSFVASLRLIMFDLPSPVIKGESVELSCIYELETDSLYSIKWYKNNVEFYRYIPRDWPKGQFLPHKGIHVDLSRSDHDSVYLRDVDLNSTGVYRCEVSAEAPSFATAEMEKEMVVHVQPSEGPKIISGKQVVKVGDVIDLSCLSAKSKPASTLRWIIGDEPYTDNSSFSTTIHEDGLITTTSDVKYIIQGQHFINGVIRVKCIAISAHRDLKMSSEIFLRGENFVHRPSHLQIREKLSRVEKGSGSKLMPPLSKHILCIVIVLLNVEQMFFNYYSHQTPMPT